MSATGAVLRAGVEEARTDISGELKIEALMRHPDSNVPDTGPRVEPGAEGVERAVVRGYRAPGEAERRHQEPAALVEHTLLDHLIRLLQQRLRNRQPEGLRNLEVDD